MTTPFVATIDSVTPVGNLTNPFPDGLLPLAGSSQGAAALCGQKHFSADYDTPLPYSVQWNFGIQRELPGSMAVNLSYAGNRGIKLPINANLNTLNPIYYGAPGDQAQVANLNALVPNPFFGVISSGTLSTHRCREINCSAHTRSSPASASISR